MLVDVCSCEAVAGAVRDGVWGYEGVGGSVRVFEAPMVKVPFRDPEGEVMLDAVLASDAVAVRVGGIVLVLVVLEASAITKIELPDSVLSNFHQILLPVVLAVEEAVLSLLLLPFLLLSCTLTYSRKL